MVRRTLLFLIATLTFADTPAKQIFSEWLEAFNSGDRAVMTAFESKYRPDSPNVERMYNFRQETGGFDLIRIVRAESTEITALLKERANGGFAELHMKTDGSRLLGIRLEDAQEPAERLTQPAAIAALEKHIADKAAAGESGAIVVARNGKVLLAKAWGMADREKQIPATTDTRFRIGSMNKMFTSVSVLQLMEKGKVELDKPVGTYLKDYPNQDVATKVTVRHLLTHTGGTGDIFGPEFAKNRLSLRALSDYVKLYGARAPQFEPGSRSQYSNYGYLLLGAIVEAVSGMSYYDYVREHVFKPAGMTRTDSLPEEEKIEGRAVGYMKRDGKLTPNTATLPVRGTSAGGGYSTAGDLQRFAQALLDGKLLKPATLAMATREQAQGYGYGFGVRDKPKQWGHGGGAPGMNGDLRVYPEAGWVVAVLANLDPPAAQRMADFFTAGMPLE